MFARLVVYATFLVSPALGYLGMKGRSYLVETVPASGEYAANQPIVLH